jgi:predicted amidophosphoribosyltransferase
MAPSSPSSELPQTVLDRSGRLAPSLRNPTAGHGVCPHCFAFHDPDYPQCHGCRRRAEVQTIDAFVPISYAMTGGQFYHALFHYKNAQLGDDAQRPLWANLTSVFWRFIAQHEHCIAQAAGVDEFDLVCVVPSKNPSAPPRRFSLQAIVGTAKVTSADGPEINGPLNARYEALLTARPGVDPSSRRFDGNRFEAVRPLAGMRVLLVEDTWVTGSTARSASHALKDAGAATVACVAIGRRLQPDWPPATGATGKRYDQLPKAFDWNTCAVHVPPPPEAPVPTSAW